MQPISFLRGDNAQYSYKSGMKVGQFHLDRFAAHEKHDWHKWAARGGRVDLFDFGVKAVSKPKISEERVNFIDDAL